MSLTLCLVILKLQEQPLFSAHWSNSMTDLSPAAVAVLDAFDSKWAGTRHQALIAALRAAADQVVPKEQRPPRRGMRLGGTGALSPDEGAEDQRAATRRKLLGIAAELEQLDD